MKVKILLNGTMREAEISSDQLLIDFVRKKQKNSVHLLQIRVQNSVVSAIRE